MRCCDAQTHYLPLTRLNAEPRGRYEVEITEAGLTVYSECCGEIMSDETMAKVRDAIDAYFAAKG